MMWRLLLVKMRHKPDLIRIFLSISVSLTLQSLTVSAWVSTLLPSFGGAVHLHQPGAIR